MKPTNKPKQRGRPKKKAPPKDARPPGRPMEAMDGPYSSQGNYYTPPTRDSDDQWRD